MKTLLVAFGAALAASIVLVPLAWSDAQAPSNDGNASPERRMEAIDASIEQSAAEARVEVPAQPTQTNNSPAAPSAQQYVKFAELHPTVQIFLQQAGKAHYKMKASEFEVLEFDPKSVEPYTAQVERLAAELKTATEIYDEEIERATELALQSGKYKDFPDETAFMKAVEAAEKSAEKPFVISLQGETEGPSGEPRPFFKLVSLKLEEHPALREAKSYKDNHEQWREVLRANALGLIANAHRARQEPR